MNNFENLPKNRAVIVVDGEGLLWNTAMFAHKKWPVVDTPKERDSTLMWCLFERLRKVANRFNTNKFIFAWDSSNNKAKRKEIYPDYKATRENRRMTEILPSDTPRDISRKKKLAEQFAIIDEARPLWDKVRKELLPRMGFVNQLSVDGYEGDDVIAYITKNAGRTPMVIYAEDSDLYQLITPTVCQMGVRVRKLKKDGNTSDIPTLDRQKFMTLFGITPEQWAEVKTIGGCVADNVPGVKGVGRKTAIQYVKDGHLLRKNGTPSMKQLAIDVAREKGLLDIYRKLVTIPFVGFPGVELKPFNVNKKGFLEICEEYDLGSLVGEEFWEEFFD